MSNEYFKGIGKIQYEGPTSDNPLSFKYYQADKEVAGKPMKDHFRFAVAYWHAFCNGNSDPFGSDTRVFPWVKPGASPMDNAKTRLDAAFEFFTKLGVEYYCFHDRDIAPEGSTVAESEKNLQEIVALAKQQQQATGVKLLWGTANMFSNPRYMNGAATNPNFQVLCHAAAQVKAAIDATVELGGENYVFWGGREGYMSLLNTDMKRELEHLAKFMQLARDYGRSVGFKGNFLIEPKPAEPSKHQYDFDAATVIGFLRKHGLDKDFKLNIEANHVTLAGHTFEHDLQVATDEGMLGSVDANVGDMQNGWDTDYFPYDVYDTTKAMMILLQSGGLAPGGFNFDAKIRRNSTDLEDLFIAHIGGMDTFAQGLMVANAILTKSKYLEMRKQRYASYDSGDGKAFEDGQFDLAQLAQKAAEHGEPATISGKQELYDNLINQYLFQIK